MNIKEELKKGSSAKLILSVLAKEELYGYMIVKRIAERGDNAFMLKEGTLYPILHNFEVNGYVKSYTVEAEGRKRKYYKITRRGLKQLAEVKEERSAYSSAVGEVIGAEPSTTLLSGVLMCIE